MNKDKKKYQYIGPSEIQSVEDIELSGKKFKKVTYKEGGVEVLSDMMFNEIVKDTSTSFEDLRNNRLYPVVNGILRVLLDWNIKVFELDYLLALTKTSVQMNEEAADEYLWKTDKFNKTMIDIENVSQSKNRKITLDEYLGEKKS